MPRKEGANPLFNSHFFGCELSRLLVVRLLKEWQGEPKKALEWLSIFTGASPEVVRAWHEGRRVMPHRLRWACDAAQLAEAVDSLPCAEANG